MKMKWYMATFVMVAGFVVLLILSSMIGNAGMTSLPEQYPQILEGKEFHGEILWDGCEEGIQMLLTDDQFQTALCSGEVREKGSFDAQPSPAFEIHFTDGTEGYSLCVGADGRISVAQVSDLAGTRRFFLDRTGSIFRALYEEHLLSGGMEIPETEK